MWGELALTYALFSGSFLVVGLVTAVSSADRDRRDMAVRLCLTFWAWPVWVAALVRALTVRR